MADQEEITSKESSSIYERLYPVRIPLMACGGFVFFVGLGMFIGGFAGLVSEMRISRRTGAPNIGYLLLLIMSVVVMVSGGVCLFCGCGTIRYKKRQEERRESRKRTYKVIKSNKAPMITHRRSTPSFSASKTSTYEPNGDVTYTVMYQYRGPPPGEIDGIPAYPAPPPNVPPILKIDASNGTRTISHPKNISTHDQRQIQIPQNQLRPIQTPGTDKKVHDLELANVPKRLVLMKRI